MDGRLGRHLRGPRHISIGDATDLWEIGDTVVARFRVNATHRGELWGIPATGRRMEWQAVMIYKFRYGKVAKQWAAED